MKRTLHAAWLALQESLSRPTLQRNPEPTPDMRDAANVLAFHAQGAEEGALLGVYHFNAKQIHKLVPEGGTVVDLGCGSGQCLGYLAQCRPDLHLVGLDLSEKMVDVGTAQLKAQGLSERVELRVGNMTSFVSQVPRQVHLVTSIFSLHHLPTHVHLKACLGQIAQIQLEQGAGFWIFDHVRPRRRQTADRFPAVFTPAASPEFNTDSTNSLIASWSFEELCSALTTAFGPSVQGALARVLRLYQVHWCEHGLPVDPPSRLWHTPQSAHDDRILKDAAGLAALFGKLPA